MPGSYMDQERQRTAEFREEQLDWLHQHHEQLVRQTALLERIAQHTGLLYAVTIVSLSIAGLYLLLRLAVAIASS